MHSHDRCDLCKVSASRENGRTTFLVNVHDSVVNSGKFNYEGCKIPINHKLNFPFLRHMLADYKDYGVC